MVFSSASSQRYCGGFYVRTRQEDSFRNEYQRLRQAVSSVDLPLNESYFGEGQGCVFFNAGDTRLVNKGMVAVADDAFALLDGALHNRNELLKELRPDAFNPLQSDAELVLAAYRRWGARCFERLYGDYAIVVWSPDQDLTCAVSPGGARWLYYYFSKQDAVIRFATHVPLLIGEKNPRGDRDYFARLFQGGLTGERTPFEAVRRLRPGHAVTFGAGGCREFRWWKIPEAGSVKYRDRRDYEQHLRSLLKEAVRCRIAGHRHVCISLSGGIDSGAVAVCAAELAREAGVELTAMTVSTPDSPKSDEGPFGREAAKRLGIPHESVTLSAKPATMSEIAQSAGRLLFPADDFFLAPMHAALARAVAQWGGTMVLNGAAGEAFFGDLTYLGKMLTIRQVFRLCAEILYWRAKGFGLLRIARDIFRSLQDRGKDEYEWNIKSKPWMRFAGTKRHENQLLHPMVRNIESFLTELPLLDETMLPAIYEPLGVATAAPFLDRRVLEFAYAIPLHLRVPKHINGLNKPLLRSAFPEISSDTCLRADRVSLCEHVSSEWARCAGEKELMRMVSDVSPMFDELIDRAALLCEITKLRQPSEEQKVSEAVAVVLWAHGLRQQGVTLV